MLEVDIKASVGTLDLAVKLPAARGVTVVIGPNGAGKSTFLKCLLGVVRPTGGKIVLGGATLFEAGSANVPLEDRRLGYLPQRYAVFPHMTVSANVGFGVRDPAERASRVRELLDDLGIAHLAQRKSDALSGGESQRVALARALAIGPRALLLDEPMAALDATARGAVRTFLRTWLAGLDIPTVIVSHDIADAELLADRVAVLEDGHITQVGSLKELRENPASDFIATFSGSGSSHPEPSTDETSSS